MGLDKGGQLDEVPAHQITLAPFFLDLTEVTNEAYGVCVTKGTCRGHDEDSAAVNKLGKDADYRRPQQPISAVSWEDAKTFCASEGKRLPREAEWERAGRGDDGRMFPWGNEKATRELAVFGEAHTADVGSRQKGKGPYGHLDLAGNVWERMFDYFVEPFRQPVCADCADLQKNPEGRAFRGGSINWGSDYQRTLDRTAINSETVDARTNTVGFRCARATQ